MNYYPFHLGDYAAHTAHLEPMEDLAYRRMLDLYYRTEKPLPREIDQIARLIRMKGHEQAIEQVVNEFFEDCSEGWSHIRCDAEIAKMQDKQAKAKASAAASVKARSTNAQRAYSERSTDVELPTPTPTPTPEEKKDIGSASAELPTKTVTARMLTLEGVDRQSADDWLTLRKAKRLPLTPTAWDDTKAEGAKVGLTPAETVAHAVRSNWAGFKSSWYLKDAQQSSASVVSHGLAGAI